MDSSTIVNEGRFSTLSLWNRFRLWTWLTLIEHKADPASATGTSVQLFFPEGTPEFGFVDKSFESSKAMMEEIRWKLEVQSLKADGKNEIRQGLLVTVSTNGEAIHPQQFREALQVRNSADGTISSTVTDALKSIFLASVETVVATLGSEATNSRNLQFEVIDPASVPDLPAQSCTVRDSKLLFVIDIARCLFQTLIKASFTIPAIVLQSYFPSQPEAQSQALLLLAASVSLQRKKGEGRSTLRVPFSILEQCLLHSDSEEPVVVFSSIRQAVEFPKHDPKWMEPRDEESDEEYYRRIAPKTYLGCLKEALSNLAV
jgi:hypothetical protein